MTRIKTKACHRLAAAVTAGAMMGLSTPAHAATATSADFQALTNSISTATNNFTVLMTMLGYIGGCGYAITSIYKLKAHVDNPSQVPLKDGMVRAAAGGALLSLPLIIRAMQGSISNGVNPGTVLSPITFFSNAVF